jgi:hypothetical protein
MNKFDKKLSEKILPKFNNAKDWSDLMTIMKHLKENLKKYNTFNMAKMSEKVLLSKRLSQSLNPILPDGLHEITLEVYDMLYENIRSNNGNSLGPDLGLYSSGLFPFFQFARMGNKVLYLNNIIKKHYLEISDQELVLCLSGFLVSILPGLEEQNETLLKSIKEIFVKARQKVGESCFYGVLWTVILRTQRMRLAGMKYISESLAPYKTLEENNFETKDEYVINFYPNLPVLVINALTAVIEDESVQVQRLALDFIITRLPITNKILSENEKVFLVISGLNLLIKNDYSTTRRLFSWLMGNQEEELEMGEPMIQYMIQLVISSIKKIFDSRNYTKEKLSNGIKIIDQLFKQQVKLVDYVLENVSIDLINCVEDYWNNYTGGVGHNNDEIIIKVKKFFDYDSAYLDCLWGSLNKLLRNAVNNSDNSINEINRAIKLLKFCLIHLRLETIDKINKFYIPIVSSLMKAMLNYKVENKEVFGEIKQLLVLALKFTQEMQEINTNRPVEDNRKKNNSSNDNNFTNFNQTRKMSKNTIKNILMQSEQNFSLLDSFKENIHLYQNFYINICKILLESIPKEKEKNQINNQDGGYFAPMPLNKDDLKFFKKATELILATQEYSNIDTLPEWIIYLVKIVFCQDIAFSLEGIYYLLDLLMVNSENEVFTNIKYYLRSEEIDEESFTQTFSKRPFFQTGVQRNCCELSMAKLWLLLEEQSYQKNVIDLLIKFYRAEPHVFSNTISNTFAINDLEQNVNAIRKFSQFWKLTSEYYPELIFFENGECIFKMLDFLDHDHPLLRHLSKSWLSQSVGHFNKILDPLLKVLLDKETTWYISLKKQLYFAKEYDNRRIIEAFRKLKNIIINMTDLAINYFVNTSISPFLLEMDETGRELSSVSRSIPMEHYLELMVSISLRFIQGKFIESVSQSFYRENFSVNAASCEFLEFLLSFIEPKSKVMNIAEMIAEPVLMILHESIMSNDEVMQVQLLNLLKVLLFNTQMVHKEFIQQAVNIFNSQLLHDCITLGIQINYIFVRSHFISFVEYCLPIFRDILDQESNLRIAHRLIITTSDFLYRRVKYYVGNNTLGTLNYSKNSNSNNLQLSPEHNKINDIRKLSHMFSLMVTDNNEISNGPSSSKFFLIKNYLEEYKDFKSFDENDVHVIIKGLKQILFHFFSIENPISSADKIQWNDFKKLIYSNKPRDSFKDYLGGLFSSKTFEENVNKKTTSEISQAIFAIFEEVLASLLTCWVNESDTYMTKDLCLNENGILAYNVDEIKFQNLVNEEMNTGIGGGQLHPSMQIKNANGPHFKNNLKNSKVLKNQIVNINLNLFLANPIEYMNKFLSLWMNEKNRYIQKDKQYKLSMIELLVSMNIPMEILISTIIKNINANRIKEYKKSKVKIKDFFPYYLNKEQLTYEAKICHLVYSYIIFNTNLRVDKTCIDIWNEMLNFFNIFCESKAPSTLFWIFEILNIMLHKLPIRETSSDKSIRQRLTIIATNLFNKTMDLSVNNKIDVIFEEASPLILPMNPSIYEKVSLEIYDKEIYKINSLLHERLNYNQLEKKNSQKMVSSFKPNESNGTLLKNSSQGPNNSPEYFENSSDESIRTFYHILFDYVSNGTILKNEELLLAYRNIGFITLKSLFYTTMKNIFLPDKNEKMVLHVQSIVKNLIFIMNERIGVNKIYVDLATEFFHSLMLSASALTSNSCKQMIMDFFLEPVRKLIFY